MLEPSLYTIQPAIITRVYLMNYGSSFYFSIDVQSGSTHQGYPAINLHGGDLLKATTAISAFLGVDEIDSKLAKIEIPCYKISTESNIFLLFNPQTNQYLSFQVDLLTDSYQDYISKKKENNSYSSLNDKDVLLYGFILDTPNDSPEAEHLHSWAKAKLLATRLNTELEDKPVAKAVKI